MGALSYMAAGMAQGLGRGAADYGVDLMRQADKRELLDERQRDRMELLSARQAAGSGGKRSAAQELSELGDMLLSGKGRGALMLGGMSPEAAADVGTMAAGGAPTREVDMPASRFTNPDRMDAAAAGPTTAQAPKYSSGQAAELFRQSYTALRRAMGIANPESADDVAKAEQTEFVTGALKRYEGGDTAAGRAALAGQGKTTFGTSGDELTGAVPKGSVAESQVRENNAQAGAAGASARQHNAAADKLVSEMSGELSKGVSKERLATMLNSLNTYAKDMDLTPQEKADLNALRQRITKQMGSEVDSRGGGARRESGGLPSPKTKAEYDALKPGTRYVAPDGKIRTKG